LCRLAQRDTQYKIVQVVYLILEVTQDHLLQAYYQVKSVIFI
jgi:hypothetical protein